jgi:hypothetical protein
MSSRAQRQLPDGSLIVGLYHEDEKKNLAFGATVKSYDGGETWKELALIGEKSGVFLDAETDVVPLKGASCWQHCARRRWTRTTPSRTIRARPGGRCGPSASRETAPTSCGTVAACSS